MIGRLLEFFGLIKRKKTPEEIERLINNDPVLQKLQNDLRTINNKSKKHLDKVKNEDPKLYKWLKDTGMIHTKY